MKSSYKINLIIMILLLCILVMSTTAYAWLSNSEGISSMQVNILQIDSIINLYEANDANYNGVYDLLAEDNVGKYYYEQEKSYIEYSDTYYKEKYSFNLLNEKWAMTNDTVLNLFDTFTLENVMPSKIYGYKFEIINYLGIDANFEFKFEADNSLDATMLQTMEVRLGVVSVENGSDATVTFTEWTSFTNEGFALGKDMVVPGYAQNNGRGRLDIWIQIRQKEDTDTYYNKFTLPAYRLSLSITTADS